MGLVYGDDAVMRDQLQALEATASMPNISVQIMPFRSTKHTGGDGPLSVIDPDAIEISEEIAQHRKEP